ncbi:MAG: intradiol ring-cleavage dioxygenase [Dehalococcoidia bacterium]
MCANLNKKLTRREVLGLIAAAGAVAVVGCSDDNGPSGTATATSAPAGAPTSSAAATATPAPSTLSCIVSPEMTEGPFFVDEMLNRSDITADPSDGSVSDGVPLALTLNIYEVNGDECVPLAGALIDIWHCDAAGAYSDVEQNGTAGRKFLRGYQVTDDNGAVQFATIYPGWYSGRAVHIHLKARSDPDAPAGYEFTTQLFFDDDLTDEVYTQSPYNTRGERDVRNADDNIFSGGGDQMLLPITQSGDGYAATFSIGVEMA